MKLPHNVNLQTKDTPPPHGVGRADAELGGDMKRRWRWPALVLVLGVGVLLVANITGVAPVPNGPLGGHEAAAPDPGGVSTLNYVADRAHIYLTPLVENTGLVPVTIVRVTPVGVTVPGSVRVIGSLPINMDDPAERGPDGMDTIALGVQPDPGPGWGSPQPVAGVTVDPKGTAQHQGRAFLVEITPDPTQETGVLRFDVEYAIGPLHFVTTAWGPLGTTVTMCPQDRPLAQDGCVAG
jgi:hypothetical protein